MDCKSICWQNDNTKYNAVCSNQDLWFSLKNMTTRRSKNPYPFCTCNWRARQKFHNKNIGSSLSFNLIFSIVHWSNVIGFFLVMKHYKRDTFPWVDTIGAAVFDWRKLLYTDVANTHTYWNNLQRGVRVQVTYIQSRTPWYFHINNYCWWCIYVKAKYLVHFPRFF